MTPHHTRTGTTLDGSGSTRRLLITAGPTQEPIDAVRYLGNRSSGRLGIQLARSAAAQGWAVTLLLGPVSAEVPASDPQPGLGRLHIERFRTTADLHSLMLEHAPRNDVLIMAAAVADYRPVADEVDPAGKRRRVSEGMMLHLEATPDLLAEVSTRKRDDQLFVGFALEPRDEMLASARRKLERKRVDLIVANPLETMDAAGIEAVVLGRDGTGFEDGRRTPGVIDKSVFAPFLLHAIEEALHAVST